MFFFFPDPPEVAASERTVNAWPGGKAILTCMAKAEPKPRVSKKCDLLFHHRIIIYRELDMQLFS